MLSQNGLDDEDKSQCSKVRYDEHFDILTPIGFMAILAGAPWLHEVQMCIFTWRLTRKQLDEIKQTWSE